MPCIEARGDASRPARLSPSASSAGAPQTTTRPEPYHALSCGVIQAGGRLSCKRAAVPPDTPHPDLIALMGQTRRARWSCPRPVRSLAEMDRRFCREDFGAAGPDCVIRGKDQGPVLVALRLMRPDAAVSRNPAGGGGRRQRARSGPTSKAPNCCRSAHPSRGWPIKGSCRQASDAACSPWCSRVSKASPAEGRQAAAFMAAADGTANGSKADLGPPTPSGGQRSLPLDCS